MVSYLCDICGDICYICGTGGVIQDPAHLDVLFMTLCAITVVHCSSTSTIFKKTSFVPISHQNGTLLALSSQAEDFIAPLKSSHDLEAPHCIAIALLRYNGSLYLKRSLLYSGIHFIASNVLQHDNAYFSLPLTCVFITFHRPA